MSELTALERAAVRLVGDHAELSCQDGRITITKDARTGAEPTSVSVEVAQVRGAQVETPGRGSRGWLHLGVVGGSPAPPGELAAMGDPYTVPLSGRSVAAARRFVKLVDRHVRERGMPPETPTTVGRVSSSVSVTTAARAEEPRGRAGLPPPPPPPPPGAPRGSPSSAASGTTEGHQPSELVTELQALADLHRSGAQTDEEFELAKARLLR